MKKFLKSALLFLVFIIPLAACSNETNELEGESFSVFTPNPTDDYSDLPEIPSKDFVFKFEKNGKMEVIRYGEEYSGTYELNDKNELIMTVDDKDKNTVDFAIRSFEPHEKNNDVYIGTVAKSDVPEGHALTNEFYSFSIEEPIGFQKIDD